MIQTIKQNKKAVLAFLLALVMLIGIIPFTATEVQAVTIPVGDITTNNSFGNGDTWQDGDQIKIERTVGYGSDYYTYTASVDENGITTWALDKKLYWDGKEEHILAAFYPAAGQDDYRSFELPEDQSTLEKLKLADCMNAVWVGNPTTDPINFQMKHRLSMVTVNYEFASEFTNATVDNVKVIPSDPFVMFDAEDGGKMDEPYGVFGTTIDAYHDADNKTIQAIVIPCTYPEGQLFMTLEVNGEELQVKMPEAKTLEEGTHYTFDLKVGKDAVTIEQVSASSRDYPFSEGWRGDTETDLGADSITDTQDEGKTAWDDGDQIIATLTSQRYGEQTATLTYDGVNWTHPEDMTFKYLDNETPTVKAVYAPSNILGTGEYIEFDCELNGGELTVKLESATRNYSRLRIAGLPNQTLTVTTTDFTPAGATEVATAAYTLTTDNNGNAFLYGVFAEGATVSVKQGEVTLKDYTFTAEKNPGGTANNKSYALDATPVIDGTLGGKTTATEEEVNALVEQLKVYVDNGITTVIVTGSNPAMIDMVSWTNTAIGEAIYRLSGSDDYDENNPYNGKIDLILPDVTEIVDQEFYSAWALNSITLPKVIKIGDEAFHRTWFLKTITFESVLTEVNETGGVMFAQVGKEVEGCDLILNCGQMNESSVPAPDLTNNIWKFKFENEFKSITLTHTGECDECKAQ